MQYLTQQVVLLKHGVEQTGYQQKYEYIIQQPARQTVISNVILTTHGTEVLVFKTTHAIQHNQQMLL